MSHSPAYILPPPPMVVVATMLLFHDCVVVPSFGSFVVRRFVPADSTGYAVSFHPQLRHDDGMLTQTLAHLNRYAIWEARRDIAEWVAGCEAAIQEEGRIKIGAWGELRRAANDTVQFYPNDSEKQYIKTHGKNIGSMLKSKYVVEWWQSFPFQKQWQTWRTMVRTIPALTVPSSVLYRTKIAAKRTPLPSPDTLRVSSTLNRSGVLLPRTAPSRSADVSAMVAVVIASLPLGYLFISEPLVRSAATFNAANISSYNDNGNSRRQQIILLPTNTATETRVAANQNTDEDAASIVQTPIQETFTKASFTVNTAAFGAQHSIKLNSSATGRKPVSLPMNDTQQAATNIATLAVKHSQQHVVGVLSAALPDSYAPTPFPKPPAANKNNPAHDDEQSDDNQVLFELYDKQARRELKTTAAHTSQKVTTTPRASNEQTNPESKHEIRTVHPNPPRPQEDATGAIRTYKVLLGAFDNEETAYKLTERARQNGYYAYVRETGNNTKRVEILMQTRPTKVMQMLVRIRRDFGAQATICD